MWDTCQKCYLFSLFYFFRNLIQKIMKALECRDILQGKVVISETLRSYPLLKSPSFDIDYSDRCPLMKFDESDAFFISSQVILSINKTKDRVQINEKYIDWILNCYGYLLRVENYPENYLENYPKNYLLSSLLQFYNDKINSYITFHVAENKQENYIKYIKACFCHLSQMFLNEKLKAENLIVQDFLLNLFENIEEKLELLSNDILTVIFKFMLYGYLDTSSGVNKEPAFIKILQDKIFSILIQEKYYNNGLLSSLDYIIDKLFNLDTFKDLWIKNFREQYRKMIFSNEPNQLIEYFILKINKFDKMYRDEAFSTVISLWKLKGCAMPTKIIFKNFGNWISTSIKMNKDDYTSHPLFDLIKFGDEQNEILNDIAYNHVLLQLNTNKETDLYWYLPVYACDYLICNQEILKQFNIAEFLSRLQNKERIDLGIIFSIAYITISFICSKITNDSFINEVTNNFFRVTQKLNPLPLSLVVISLFLYVISNRIDLFWHTFKGCMKTKISNASNGLISSYAIIAVLVGIFSSFFNLNISCVDNINEYMWNLINNHSLSLSELFMFLLSFYFLVLKTNVFRNCIDLLPKINEYLDKKINTSISPKFSNSDVNIINNLRKMIKLAILTGGKLDKCSNEFAINENVKAYFFKNYIISIHNESYMAIRHALGMNVYYVMDVTNFSNSPNTIENSYTILPNNEEKQNTCYKSKNVMDSNSIDSFEKLNEFSQLKIDFTEFNETKKSISSSSVQSLLINTGFISSTSKIHVLCNISDYRCFGQLDNKLNISTNIPITILQLVYNDEKNIYELGSHDSSILDSIKDEIKKYDLDTFNFKINSPKEHPLSYYIKDSEIFGFLFILNEDNIKIDFTSEQFKNYKFIISFSPIDKDYYIFNINSKSNIFPEFRNIKVCVNHKLLCLLILIFSILQRGIIVKSNNNSTTDTSHQCNILPNYFSKGFNLREMMIKGIKQTYFQNEKSINLQDLIQQFD